VIKSYYLLIPRHFQFSKAAISESIPTRVGVQTAYIEPGSPWKNGYCESFNGKFRDQFLNGEIFYSLKEAAILIERWRYHYNHVRPHSSLGFRPPAPLTKLPAGAGS
jgi:transposase InsO family protein